MPEDRLRTREVEQLLHALLALDTTDDAFALLQDLCTVREIQEMASRLEVARLLAAGEHYSAIQEMTGASATTIARVSKALHYGADGYARVLDRLEPRRHAGHGSSTSTGSHPDRHAGRHPALDSEAGRLSSAVADE